MGFGTYIGPLSWSLEQDELGYRTYSLTSLIQAALTTDGPASALFCPGAPAIGSTWTLGSILDPWVWCRPEASVQQYQTSPGEPSVWWTLRQKFSNKPFSSKKRNSCRNTSFQDPLSEPPLISGSFTKRTEERKRDKDGNEIRTSGFDYVTGPQAEWDVSRPNVHIEQNVASLGLATFTQMIDTVNDSPLWGLPKRCIKLTNVQWDRKIYGTCAFYYTRKFDFDINFETFDREILNVSAYCLAGDWIAQSDGTKLWTERPRASSPGPPVQEDFIRMQDKNGAYIEGPLYSTNFDGFHAAGARILNGDPVPNIDLDPVKYYPESNFLTLGIPTSF